MDYLMKRNFVMKLKSVVAGVAALLTLSACAEYDNFMDGMSDLKNQGSALFGGAVEKASPAQICKEYRENSMMANRKYIGKTIHPTGKVLRIYKDDFSKFGKNGGTILENTYRVVMQVGSERINAGMSSSAAAANLKVGQIITMNGQIESLGGDDTGSSCIVLLRHSVPVTK